MGRQREGEEEHDGPNTYPMHLGNQLRSKKGQAFLRETLGALDAMPEKKLIAGAIAKDGCTCGLGAVILARRVAAGEDRDAVLAELTAINVDVTDPAFDGEEMHEWAKRVMDAPILIAYEIADVNDRKKQELVPCFDVRQWGSPQQTKIIYIPEDPADRFARVRRFIERLVQP